MVSISDLVHPVDDLLSALLLQLFVVAVVLPELLLFSRLLKCLLHSPFLHSLLELVPLKAFLVFDFFLLCADLLEHFFVSGLESRLDMLETLLRYGCF